MHKVRKEKQYSILLLLCLVLVTLSLGCNQKKSLPEIDMYIEEKMQTDHLPGVAVCIIKDGKVHWSNGYGWANIEEKIPMTENSIMNIASISKTVTTTAIMQLQEKDEFSLDDDINDYLKFPIRNPSYPNVPITFKQLLTHTSSIIDGSSYWNESYKCGDPTITLQTWIREYLTPDGLYFSQDENFSKFKPGEQWEYSNIGFGLLGVLIEEISGQSFADYCKNQIFLPLGMEESSWYLSDFDKTNHALLYSYITDGKLPDLLQKQYEGEALPKEGFVPYCLYSFPNISDGLLRTSVKQLSQFLIAYLNSGLHNNSRILKESTISTILSSHVDDSKLPKGLIRQGLCWRVTAFDSDDLVWQHGGGDPGVRTLATFRPSDGIGTIVFTNSGSGSAAIKDITHQLYKKAINL